MNYVNEDSFIRWYHTLSEEEQHQLKEIDDALLWYDLAALLGEKSGEEAPEVHIDIDYTVRPFADVEKEYLAFYYSLSGDCREQAGSLA